MPNDLTGDFDVVAEFSVPAANRVLASMHRNGRFPHSLSLRVNDNPAPGTVVIVPAAVNSVNIFGDATVNQNQIGHPVPVSGRSAAASSVFSALDPVANASGIGFAQASVIPSRLQGIAQLQLAPPTLQINDRSGTNLTLQLDFRSRYFPDLHTASLAEFIRGELQLTASVSQVVSQAANVLDLDINANTIGVNFNPLWSSQPLGASDLAGASQLIRNVLRTSILPSNAALPSNIAHVQFKTLQSAPSAIGVLLNMQGTAGNAGSFNNSFLGAADDFAFAAGRDFILGAFHSLTTKILQTPLAPVSFDYDVWIHTFHITYDISLNSVTLDLQTGKIVMAIQGHAHTSTSWMPDFDFTVTQDFTLQVDGDTANLVTGNISVDTSSWVVNLFSGGATAALKTARDQALAQSGANTIVRNMLNADTNLGPILRSLLSTRRGRFHLPGFQLAYTSVDIQASGIILHGSLAVPDWPAVHVEFEKIPPNTNSAGPVAGAEIPVLADYSALNSWIPGGEIEEFDWSYQNQPQPFLADQNKFVYIPPANTSVADLAAAATAPSYAPLCLTVRGSRLPASGPAVAQSVSGKACGYLTHPIVNGLIPVVSEELLVALAQPGSNGLVQVTGYMPAEVDSTGANTPNTIVHFAGDNTIGKLSFLRDALRDSRRQDSPTAIIAVLTSEQLAKATYASGIVYAADSKGVWARTLGAKFSQKPATFILNPKSQIVWRHEGDIDSPALAAALGKALVAGGSLRSGAASLNIKAGRSSPNFLFQYAPGHELTLRKLAGRPVTLVFWKSVSQPSIDAVRDQMKSNSESNGEAPVLIAINDGDSADLARKIAGQNGFSAASLTIDPRREIALAYGVRIWPTTVFIDSHGLVSDIRYGRVPGERVDSMAPQSPSISR